MSSGSRSRSRMGISKPDRNRSSRSSRSDRSNRSDRSSRSDRSAFEYTPDQNCVVIQIDKSGYLSRRSLNLNNLINYVRVLLNDDYYVSLLLDDINQQIIAQIYDILTIYPDYYNNLFQDINLLDDNYVDENILSHLTNEASIQKLGKLVYNISSRVSQQLPTNISSEISNDRQKIMAGGTPYPGISNIRTIVGTMITCTTFGLTSSNIPPKMALFIAQIRMGAKRQHDLSIDNRRAVIIFKSDPATVAMKICKFSCNIQDNGYDNTHLEPYKWEYYIVKSKN